MKSLAFNSTLALLYTVGRIAARVGTEQDDLARFGRHDQPLYGLLYLFTGNHNGLLSLVLSVCINKSVHFVVLQRRATIILSWACRRAKRIAPYSRNILRELPLA